MYTLTLRVTVFTSVLHVWGQRERDSNERTLIYSGQLQSCKEEPVAANFQRTKKDGNLCSHRTEA